MIARVAGASAATTRSATMRPPFRPRARAVPLPQPVASPHDERPLATTAFARALLHRARRDAWCERAVAALASIAVALVPARVGLGTVATHVAEVAGPAVALPVACVGGAAFTRAVERL